MDYEAIDKSILLQLERELYNKYCHSHSLKEYNEYLSFCSRNGLLTRASIFTVVNRIASTPLKENNTIISITLWDCINEHMER